MHRTILHIIALMALAYISVCTMLFLWQERLIFYPECDPPVTRHAFAHPAEEVRLPVHGATLHALWFRVPEPQGVILYLHGSPVVIIHGTDDAIVPFELFDTWMIEAE
jgi:uncharacterized protein